MNIERYIEELATLVNVDCGTQTLEGVKTVAERVQALWTQEGWNTEQISLGDKVGPGLLVTNKPQETHFDVLLVGHLDTVFPAGTVAERPMSRDTERLYGPGVADMKSGLLNILWAIRELDAADKSRLSIAVAMQWHSVKLLPEPEKNSIAFWDA